MTEQDNFQVWQDGIPVIIKPVDREFDVWENGDIPVENVNSEEPRRRAIEY